MGVWGGEEELGVGAQWVGRVLCSRPLGMAGRASPGGPRISSSAPADSGTELRLGGRPQAHLVCGVGVLPRFHCPGHWASLDLGRAEVRLIVTVAPGGIQGLSLGRFL